MAMYRGSPQLSVQTDELVSNMSACMRVIAKNAKETLECFNEMAVRAAHSIADMPAESKLFDDLSNWMRTMDQTVKKYADSQESLRQDMQAQVEIVRNTMGNELTKVHDDVSRDIQVFRNDVEKSVEGRMESRIQELSSSFFAEMSKLRNNMENVQNEGRSKDDQIRELRVMQDDVTRKNQSYANEVSLLREDISIHLEKERAENIEVKTGVEGIRARCTKTGDRVNDVERRIADMELVEKSQHVYMRSVMEETNRKIILNEEAIKEMLGVLKSTDSDFQDWKRAMAYKVKGLSDGFHTDMRRTEEETKKRQYEQENVVYSLRDEIGDLKERQALTETYCRESIESVMQLLAAVVTHLRAVENLPNIKDTYLACRKVQERFEDIQQNTHAKKTSKV
ncbi:hypothetical protein RvY_08061 [Ramazzottius varieornatus]|uniref:Uncharacterized protein n=1 Tax=Ramazzottius varieornatus TaxID=947166 RepID=A0A1D1V999_RAMVA|nr:hypothetical protein RvY_08061 [Ramazzottius varieornatus]